MSKIFRLSNAARSAQAQALLALLAGGYVMLYDGALPANGNTLPAGVNLARVDLESPAGTQSNGVITFTVPDATVGLANSNASVGAIFTADDELLGVFNVGPTNGDGFVLELGNVAIVVGGPVEITGLTWTVRDTSTT